MSKPKNPGGTVGGIIHTRSMGLNALELGWVRSVRVSEKTCEAIRSTAEEHDVALSVHAPYFINLRTDEEEWQKSKKRLMDSAHFGNLAGATDIIFHPGSYYGNPPDEVLSISIPRLETCVKELQEAGNPVLLRPETMGKSAMLGSLEDTLEMSKALEQVEPCIDFAHLHARPGDGSMNTYDEWAGVLEAYGNALGQAALERLSIHMSGIEYGPKGEKKHLPVEESDLNLNAILEALRDFKCKGRILIESPPLENDAVLVKQRWMELSGESE
jgi:deoxyribonuclease-4